MGEAPLQALRLLREGGHALGMGLVAHPAQALGDRQHLRRALVADLRQGRQRPVEDDRVAQRVDREAVLEVPDAEAALLRIEGELEVALLQGLAVAVAEERHDELVAGPQPAPVDVEGIGRRRQGAPFEHREPPRIVGAADAHVVGHDVEQELQPVALQHVAEADEGLLAAELRVDLAVVDDVVAVHRARPRLVDRRGVDVADAELGEIRDDLGRVVEGEVLVELQPVGRPRRRRGETRGARARPALLRRERGGELGERPARRRDRVEVAVELAAPVRVALGDARHVGLAHLAQNVLVLHRGQHRGARARKRTATSKGGSPGTSLVGIRPSWFSASARRRRSCTRSARSEPARSAS